MLHLKFDYKLHRRRFGANGLQGEGEPFTRSTGVAMNALVRPAPKPATPCPRSVNLVAVSEVGLGSLKNKYCRKWSL